MSARLKKWATSPWFIAAVLGVVACLYAIPLDMIDPTSASWMNRKDTMAHWLGWEHFRHSPVWQFPLGKNELYGLERSSSIVFSDSIPLMALALHPIEALLPTPFQYLGLWTLLCFILQAYFAHRLMTRCFVRPAAAIAATALFVIAPPMLLRLHFQTSLVSHWLVLAGLHFYFDSRDARWRRWLGLLLLAILVHGYLFVMVGVLWAAHLGKVASLGGLAGGPRVVAAAALRALGVVIACLLAMWIIGYFGTPAANLRWFGSYRLDLMSPLCSYGWSGIVPELGCGGYLTNDWEGMAFAGIGAVVALLAIAISLLLRKIGVAAAAAPVESIESIESIESSGPAPRLPRWPLVVGCLALVAFAASNRVVIGTHEVFAYPLPPRLLAIAETFRGSGRMVWPAFYAGLVGLLALFARVVPARWHAAILIPAALLQAYDVRTGIVAVNKHYPSSHDYPVLEQLADPAWRQLERYEKLVEVPAISLHFGWQNLVWQAAKSGVGINSAYTNRVGGATAEVERATLRKLIGGQRDPGSVYLFFEKALWDVAREIKAPGDVALIADGYPLLFPDGARLGLRDSAEPRTEALPLGQWRSTAGGGDGNLYMTGGWSWTEGWGRWSGSDTMSIVIPQPESELGEARTVVLDVLPYMPPGLRGQRYQILVWNQLVAEGVLKEAGRIELAVPAALNTRRSLFLEIDLPDAVAGPDTRLLGMGLKRLWISDEPGARPPPDPVAPQ